MRRFEAYYREIYPYLPILPHPSSPIALVLSTLTQTSSSSVSNPPSVLFKSQPNNPASFPTSSPLILAILAILTLEAHPADPSPDSEVSKSIRSRAAEKYAREASRSLEQALRARASGQPTNSYRGGAGGRGEEDENLELVQAAVVLGKYEFAEKGDVEWMRKRTVQAVQLVSLEFFPASA